MVHNGLNLENLAKNIVYIWRSRYVAKSAPYAVCEGKQYLLTNNGARIETSQVHKEHTGALAVLCKQG